MDIEKIVEEFNLENALQMDGYDDCLVGVVERFGMEPVLCYDREAVIEKFIDMALEDGDGVPLDPSEAWEWYYHNQLGAWMGEGTPCFITVIGTTDQGETR